MQNAKIILETMLVLLLLTAASADFADAAKPDPTQPSAVQIPTGSTASVDGSIGDGEVGSSVVMLPLFIAGDESKTQAAEAFLVYNPETSSMYVRVEVNLDEVSAYFTNSGTWITIDGINNKIVFSEFQYLGEQDIIYGYEASFEKLMVPYESYDIIIHINVRYQGTATAATVGFQGKVGQPIFVVPETFIGTTIISIFTAGAIFGLIKHVRTKQKTQPLFQFSPKIESSD